MSADMVEVQFVNLDAIPKTQIIRCDRESVPLTMRWYAAYFAKEYTVFIDGVRAKKDRNGELIQ